MKLHIKKYLSPIIIGLIVIIFGLFVSNYFGLYGQIKSLDKVYHVLGGVILGWFFYRYFNSPQTKLTSLNLLLVSVSTVCFIGVLWEFMERLSSLYSPQYFPWLLEWFRSGDLNDSLLDLVADMSGGFIFVAASLFTRDK